MSHCSKKNENNTKYFAIKGLVIFQSVALSTFYIFGCTAAEKSASLIIYGGTSCGIMAAAQEIDYDKLAERLLMDKQRLSPPLTR